MAKERKGGRDVTENLHNDRFSSHAVVYEGDDGLWYRTSLMGYTEGEAMRSARDMNRYYKGTVKHSVVNARGYIYPPEEFV